MSIHSKFLVHWTGKDIEKGSDVTIKTSQYIERLKDYYENGLYAKRLPKGQHENTIGKKKIKRLVRICFTEIRLSQAQEHAKRYGKLGIGFSRDFIINEGGCPVIYIPKKASCLLEGNIRNAYNKSENDEDVHRSIKYIMTYVKPMSNKKSEDSKDYEDYYEEMEWRLVYDENPNNTTFTRGEVRFVHRIKFEPIDVKVIIFPDERTKLLSLDNKTIKDKFSKHMPSISTLDDCRNF